MGRKKTGLAIVNRGFWPGSQVIGESLLQFAEKAALDRSVCVITQAEGDLASTLANAGRGEGVQIRASKAYTTSGSGLIKRITESLFFMIWTFISLVRVKPASVYVSTNPPVVVPFIVAIYCRIFGATYVYHLQDIHPEAANIVMPLNRTVFRFLRGLDNFTMRHAAAIITLSEDMREHILACSGTERPIYLLDNPSFDIEPSTSADRNKDIVFCGNAGRLQRIPLLLRAISDYLNSGGKLKFTFAGAGVYEADIRTLAESNDRVQYLGVISAIEAADLVNQHRWALLPIDDEVTRYAFPSKSSSYALSGATVLAICGKETSVARWVEEHGVGIVCAPEHNSLVSCFHELEETHIQDFCARTGLRERLQIPYFAQQLNDIFFTRTPTNVDSEC